MEGELSAGFHSRKHLFIRAFSSRGSRGVYKRGRKDIRVTSPWRGPMKIMTEWTRAIGQEFVGVESANDVYAALLNIVDLAIDPDARLVSVADGDSLLPVACRPATWNPEPISITTTTPGCAYRLREPCLIDDLTDVRSASSSSVPASPVFLNFDHDLRSMLVAPIGDVGVVLAAASERGAFTEADKEEALVLADVAAGALERLDNEASGGPSRLEEIASILSHDLKSPLQVARGHIQLAEETGDIGHLSKANDALDRITHLADDLVMLARTDTRINEPEFVPLSKLVRTAWKPVKAPEATLEVVQSARILADESTACQLLENLFVNAITHAGPAVTIRIGLVSNGFYVEDDGPGIPSDLSDRIFEWGFSSADGHPGIGLGIVDRIADGHGWDGRATASPPGGARFEFTDVEFEELQ